MQSNTFSNLKSYLVPLGSILVVIFLVPTVVLPQIQKIRDNLEVVNKDSQRLKKLEAKATSLEQLADAEEQLDKNLALAESALPIEKDIARLVRGVQNLAASNGLEVSKVEIKPGKTATESASQTSSVAKSSNQNSPEVVKPSERSKKQEFIFELSLRGNVAAFQSFLKSVEGTKRLLIMSSFKSTLGSGSDYTFSVTINAPFGPLPKIAQDQLAKAIEELSANNKKLLKDLEGSVFKNVTNDPLPTGPTGVADPFK